MTKKNTPQAGEHFNYNGIEFVALGEEQGGILAVVAKCLDNEMKFDKNDCNNWRKSTLRRYLNEEYIKNFNKADLLPFVSDLTTDSGQKDYGTSEDYIALLSCDLYRKYREVMPKYDTWVWMLTPWHIFPSNACSVRIVDTDSSVINGGVCSSYGVAPACIFNPELFVTKSEAKSKQKYLFTGKRVDNGKWVYNSETYICDGDGVWLSDEERNVVKVVPGTISITIL